MVDPILGQGSGRLAPMVAVPSLEAREAVGVVNRVAPTQPTRDTGGSSRRQGSEADRWVQQAPGMGRLDGAERVFRHLTDLVEAVGDDLERNLERGDTQIEDERLLASLRTTAKEIVSAATFGANPVFARPTVDTAPRAMKPALAAYRQASRPLDSLHEAPQVRQVLDETQQTLTGSGGILEAIDRLDRRTVGEALPAIREALLSARENLRTTRETVLERTAEEPWMGPLDLAV